MADIVLDTNILADMLAQYFEENFRERGYFTSKGQINEDLVSRINHILRWHVEDNDTPYPGLVIASTFAFLEIARQFDRIVNQRFTLVQFAAFIDQPPEWFLVSAVDQSLFLHLSNLPRDISLPNGDRRPIEWADAIHIATALSRDEPCLLATSDNSIRAVELLVDRII